MQEELEKQGLYHGTVDAEEEVIKCKYGDVPFLRERSPGREEGEG